MQKKLMRWEFGVVLAAALLCLAGAPAPASAAMSPEDRAVLEVEDVMQGIDMEAVVRRYWGGGSPEKNRIMARNLKAILVDRGFVRYFWEQGREIGLWDEKDTLKAGERAGRLMLALAQSLGQKGFARLSAADQRAVIHYNRLMVEKAVNGRVCRAVQLGTEEATPAEIRRSTRRLLDEVSLQDLSAYSGALKRAVLAEVRQDPPVRSITRAQAELAGQALERALDQAMDGLSPRELERLIPAMEDLEGVPPEDACSAMRLMLRAVDGLSGDVGDWVRTDFFKNSLGAY